jgi:Outer membrane protein beta-barrel domain
MLFKFASGLRFIRSNKIHHDALSHDDVSMMPLLARFCFLSGLLAAWGVAASPLSALVDDDFKASTDSLWHFQTATFRDGVFSPGNKAEIPGRDAETGQLKIDTEKGQLVFLPRKLSQAYRSCFMAFRDDFLIEGAYAGRVRIELAHPLINPSSNDSLGGLFALIQYREQNGRAKFLRSATPIGVGVPFELGAKRWYPIEAYNWLITEPAAPHVQSQALSRVTGIGILYIPGTTVLAGSTALRITGFKATGEMAWPRLTGRPESAVLWAGDTVELGWHFPSRLRAHWSWYRNEKPIPGAHASTYRFATTLNDARTHVFRAEAQLGNGEKISTETIRVQVKGKVKPVIRRQIHDTTVPIGGEVIFAIKAEGIPPLKYQWYHQGKPLPGANADTLVLVPSHMRQGGLYQCEVTDRWGAKVRSHSAGLLVKPSLDDLGSGRTSYSVAVKAGVNATDFYQADPNGYPDTRYAWNYMHLGVQGLWEITPRIALQGDLLFSRKGVRWDFEDHFDELKLDYAEIPLFLRVSLTKKNSRFPVHFLLGGYGALLVDAQHQEDWGDWKGDISAGEFTWYDFGPSLGMVMQSGGLSLEARASVGAANLNDFDPQVPVRMWTASVMIGFTLIAPQEMAQ